MDFYFYVLGGIVGLVLAHFAFVDGFCVAAPGGSGFPSLL
jgi:hypothetical protein